MTLQIEMVGEMIHIKCEGEKGQFYAPLSQAEYETVCNLRAMKDIEIEVTGDNEKSPNQRAVEDIAALSAYLKANNITYAGDPINNAMRCMETRLGLITDVTNELNNRQTISYINEYQNKAAETAIYPGKGTPLGLIYCTLKLCGEAGEVSENVGKALRDDDYLLIFEKSEIVGFQELEDDRRNKLKLELGDVLWYVSQAAKELGFTLEEIAEENLSKLASRQERGTLKGSGDER